MSESRILIVDDHPLVNHGLAEVIAAEESLTVCGQATSAAEAARLFESTHPDLVILDLLLPDGDGFELLAEFIKGDNGVQVLVFSSLDPDVFARKARELGAAGFVHKSMVIGEIVPAIRAALEESKA